MSTIGERIKIIRTEQHLTQEKFCEAIGLKRNSIALIESGKRGTTEPVLRAICREYHVSRAWLENGEGEIYDHTDSNDEELARLLANMVNASEEKKSLLILVASMPDDLAKRLIEYLQAQIKQK